MKVSTKDTRALLESYVRRMGSQRRAAVALGIGAATISDILKGREDRISEDMYKMVYSRLSNTSADWNIVQTAIYEEISSVLTDAKLYQNVTWIVGAAGTGKTTTAKSFSGEHSNAFYVLCSEDMSQIGFLTAICQSLGINPGENRKQTLDIIFQTILRLESPVLIFDEADKLKDSVFHYYVHIYNVLEDHAGMVFLSTPYIKKRMSSGLRCNKRGYHEAFSRIGGRFYDIEQISANDIAVICKGNGIEDNDEIARIIKDADMYNCDIRRVKKMIKVSKRA